MTGSIESTESQPSTMPPIGVPLEVKYAAGVIGFAFWTGKRWHPRYLAMAPIAWRRSPRYGPPASSDWTPCADITTWPITRR